jgi:hypothetical protein
MKRQQRGRFMATGLLRRLLGHVGGLIGPPVGLRGERCERCERLAQSRRLVPAPRAHVLVRRPSIHESDDPSRRSEWTNAWTTVGRATAWR